MDCTNHPGWMEAVDAIPDAMVHANCLVRCIGRCMNFIWLAARDGMSTCRISFGRLYRSVKFLCERVVA